MINARAYKNYFGGKSSPGTYQTIINHIPPHDVFLSLFLGNCSITRNIKAASFNILNDLDTDVIEAWDVLDLPPYYKLLNFSALHILKNLSSFTGFDPVPGTVFIYLDPPYRLSSRKSGKPVYKHEMTDSDHSDLLSQIVAMSDHKTDYKLKIMISHYPDEMYDETLKGWNTKDFYSTIRNGVALERIYYNYELTGELQDYSYIGDDFRERETYTRIKKNFIKKLNRLPAQLRNSILQSIDTRK